MIFKAGDRVWFGGNPYTVEPNSMPGYTIKVAGHNFTEDGRFFPSHKKPVLKLVKKKKRRELWVNPKLFMPDGVPLGEMIVCTTEVDAAYPGCTMRFVEAKENKT